MEYNPRLKKRVRQLRPEVGDLLTWSFVSFVIVACIILYIINPYPTPHLPTAPSPAQTTAESTRYEELLLSFYSEPESRACLKWLNASSQSRLWQSLSTARINSSRIENIVVKRPYKTWLEVYYLPNVGIGTIEQIITVWRKTN